jgi:hypothetical protein
MITVTVLLFITQLALSVEVSQAKLDELTAILKSYTTITSQLLISSQSSKIRIDDLQSGFDQYKKTVDILLLKAKRQECELKLWRIVGICAGVLAGSMTVWAVLK